MAPYLVIHGHFYQPPTDDPWTGQVHDLSVERNFAQKLKRLTKECYAANGASRVLGPDGRIDNIVNNYSFTSFSFDPWLLGWLKKNTPNVYERILEGDRESLEWNGGHGNAVAQSWGHTILPLETRRDVETLVSWGREDFIGHFRREPEGIWLPEMAVSPMVLDELIRQSFQYVVLSPWQAEGIMPLGEGSWTPLGPDPAPSDRAFRIDRPEGSIAVFFFNTAVSQGLVFDHFLRDADLLLNVLKNHSKNLSPDGLLSLVNQGELFGHLEPFGDMCLSALFQKVRDDGALTLTNFGRYLDLHPPRELVKLKKGEEELGVSWSCFHGVSRWWKACGCADHSKPDWTQNWRTPLRQALVNLKSSLNEIFEREWTASGLADPLGARLSYGSVLCGRIASQEFMRKFLGPEMAPDRTSGLLKLLEGQKYARQMFDSSAWHFADPGEEPTLQALGYALKAIELYRDFTPNDLLFDLKNDLKKVIGNGTVPSDGEALLTAEVIPKRKTPEFAAALFILDTLLRHHPSYTEKIGFFRLHSFTRKKTKHSDHLIEFSGEIELADLSVLDTQRFGYTLLEDLKDGVSLFFRPMEASFAGDRSPTSFALDRLPMGERQNIVQVMTGDLEDFFLESTQQLLPQLRKTFLYSRHLGIAQPKGIRHLMETALNRKLACLEPAMENRLSEPQLEDLGQILLFADDYGLSLDEDILKSKWTELLALEVRGRHTFIEDSAVIYLETLFALSSRWGISPDLTVPQILVYETLQKSHGPILEELRAKKFTGLTKLKGLVRIASLLGINTDRIKEEVFSF